MNNLALCLHEQEHFNEGLELGRRVTELRKVVLGNDHPDILAAMSNEAMAYNAQGQWKKAEELIVNVFQTSRLKLGEDHPCTLVCSYNLALIHIGLWWAIGATVAKPPVASIRV
ncbi:hypothetical protein V2G26_001786 [Clonostachys chloroleuca]